MEPYRSRPYIETSNTIQYHQIEGNQVEETFSLTPSQAAAHPLESVKATPIVLSESAATVDSTTLRTSGAAEGVIKSNDEDVKASAELAGLALSHEPKVQEAALREKFSFIEMVNREPGKCGDESTLIKDSLLLVNLVFENEMLHQEKIKSLAVAQKALIIILRKNSEMVRNDRYIYLIDQIKENNLKLEKYINGILYPAAAHPLSQTSETAVKIIKSVGEGTRAAVNLKNLSQNQDKGMEQVIAKRNFQFIDMIEERQYEKNVKM